MSFTRRAVGSAFLLVIALLALFIFLKPPLHPTSGEGWELISNGPSDLPLGSLAADAHADGVLATLVTASSSGCDDVPRFRRVDRPNGGYLFRIQWQSRTCPGADEHEFVVLLTDVEASGTIVAFSPAPEFSACSAAVVFPDGFVETISDRHCDVASDER